jgi:transposase
VSEIRSLLREYWIRFSCKCERCDGRGYFEGLTHIDGRIVSPSLRRCPQCDGETKTGSIEMLTAFLAADGDAWLQSQALLADPSVTSDNLLDRRMWLAERIAEIGGAR